MIRKKGGLFGSNQQLLNNLIIQVAVTIVFKSDFFDEEGRRLTRQPGQRKGGQGSGQKQ